MNRHLYSTSNAQASVKSATETSGMLYTLYINLLLFIILLSFFEANRYMRQIYLKRMTKKLEVFNLHVKYIYTMF